MASRWTVKLLRNSVSAKQVSSGKEFAMCRYNVRGLILLLPALVENG